MEHSVVAGVAAPTSTQADAAVQAIPCEIVFPQGLIGCPAWQHFQLVPVPFTDCGELLCLDEPGVALPVADPAWLGIDVRLELDDDDGEALHLNGAEDARILCVLTLHRAPAAVTANLAGLLIINWPERLGRQVVLDHQDYPLRAPIVSGDAALALIAALTGAEDAPPEVAPKPSASAPLPKKGA
jgi:flagellar assembly factor FliW